MGGRNKYRFLFVSAPFGGIEVFFRNLREVFSGKDEIEATWVFLEFEPKHWIAHIPPISRNWTLKGGLITRSRIRSLERSGERFDAAFVNHLILPSFLRGFMRRIPTILSLDVTPPLLDQYSQWYFARVGRKLKAFENLKYLLTRTLYSEAAYLLTWSFLVKESLMKDYGILESRIAVVPPGVDLRRWTASPRALSLTGTDTRKPKVLFVGGDFKRKGGDLLLNLAQQAEFQDCVFHFVTRESVGSAGKNVRIHSSVAANSDELISLYREADVFVLPTRADFGPALAICEAMAMELPVISTNVGSVGEIVTDGENGFVIPPGDQNALADRLRSLIASPETRVRFGRKGRQRVEAKFSLEKNAEAILEYLKLVADMNHARVG